ncbi:MAG TPA: hypothetical protein VK204_01625 [Nocardioidaceae bacterium]|nr:hypothetical protein [Nocardioidaceae bacterium]
MRAEGQFDSFYLKTRRALVHQTFALTGDLAAAQKAVRETYVSAWHHWRKVRSYEDPRDWVRPRAWALAQRKHTARLWQRTKELSVENRAILNALHKLPASERRALVLVELAGVPLDVSARELNVTQGTLERQLASGTSGFATALDTDPAAVPALLAGLGEAASKASLPRAAAVRREGRTRRRTHTLAAAAAVTFLAVGSGAFAYEPTSESPEASSPLTTPADPSTSERPQGDAEPESKLPSADDLLDVKDVSQLDAEAAWQVTGTHDNTGGNGINYVCQQERFADPEGVATLVRTLKSGAGPSRTVVQAVEISSSAENASATYDKVLSWFARCEGGNLHLQRSFAVSGVADRAVLLELRTWAPPQTSYSVSLAQVGQMVTTEVVSTANGPAPRTLKAARTLARATSMLCEQAGGSDCGGRPRLQETAPPPSGEATGVLATVDMPGLEGVTKPWVGTSTAPASRNPAATACDRADFRKEGAVTTQTRTFLVPGARLPARFGLTETYGKFRSSAAAAEFLGTVRKRVAACEDRNLAIDVQSPHSMKEGPLAGSTWRLRTELSQSHEVFFDVGFVRRGDTVAQLTFLPAGPAELSSGDFRALLVRAGQRLGEVG